MRRIGKIILFIFNLILLALSWHLFKSPHGDEFLVLFIVSTVFVFAPFVLKVGMITVLLSLNLAFLIFYHSIGALNPVDIVFLSLLYVISSLISYSVCFLCERTHEHYCLQLEGRRKKYNRLVRELENVDRRGRKIENELVRISRLYEITEKLTPALTFQELMDCLFGFLENNITFSKVHLMVFKNGKFTDAITRQIGPSTYETEPEEFDYNEAVAYSRQKDFNPSFSELEKHPELFQRINIGSDTYMQFPLFMGERLCAILAIEGSTREQYGRLSILASHIALEIRKVELYEQVQQLSITDGLTEVYLRRYLEKRLKEEIDRSRRLRLTFSVAMVDVDFFKECNDKHGHLVGDIVLNKIAERLKASVREVDLIARYGGEEFCIVLPETKKDMAMTVSERLRKAVCARPINAYGEKINITVSVGVATFPEDSDELGSLLEMADMALYKSKRSGRNRVSCA